MNRDELQRCSTQALHDHQLMRLNQVLAGAQRRRFYCERLSSINLPLTSLSQLASIPVLNKSDLVASDRGIPARIFDLPREDYSRFHQTSGTQGWPMPVLDTAQDWSWWLDCWDYVLDAAQVTREDVALMAFSFGPFIGFWTANDAIIRRGTLALPGGGMSSENRLRMIEDHRCTLVCCTPTYALHLASAAEKLGIDLLRNSVTRIIVAGEPGGSIPTVRKRIEDAWGALVVDHAGASELGAWGFGSADGRGMHVIESEFIAETLRFDDDPAGVPVLDGEPAELVLTNLGRHGGPAVRYRTGDVVQGYRDHDRACRFLWLDGGVLGRADDMLVIRGVNVFPSSVEAVVREISAQAEFRMIASRENEMDQLIIEIEADQATADQLSQRLQDRLAMRVAVTTVAPESLPRFEAKSRRLIDRRQSPSDAP